MSCNKSKRKTKFGSNNNLSNQVVPRAYWGDMGLPYRGMVNSYTDGQSRGTHSLPFMSSNYIVNNVQNYSSPITKVPVNYHSFGSNWYPNLNIDSTYSSYSGGYSYPNGGMGPYVATGLGNYPRQMYAEANRLYLNNPLPVKSKSSKNKYGKSKNNKK